MIFFRSPHETPLTQAVIEGDIEAVELLGRDNKQVDAENSLGFNALEIAKYLGRDACLKHLHPLTSKKFYVSPKGENQVRVMSQYEFETFFQIHYISHLKFLEYSTLVKVVKACPKKFREAPFSEFTDRAIKYRRQLSEGEFADVTIRWIDDRLGYGLFARKDFMAGEYLGEYVGVVHRGFFLPSKQTDYTVQYPKLKWSIMTTMIDSLHEGNESRFINHSYTPNLTVKVAVEKGIAHSLFFANQDIPKETQLTWNYGEDYWATRPPPMKLFGYNSPAIPAKILTY